MIRTQPHLITRAPLGLIGLHLPLNRPLVSISLTCVRM
ncbi:hypothetical protein PAMC26510_08615 [Caballeronia sordidicola]|uniref:Uncharacterized protein n=1 Tax=Caballeronia sordidicola TaxID=196367 RepID=A0A242N2D3_CABSO|nr:hypothetical protein PAMC26510_08615 [Caballeronia sordidicola]